MRAQVNRAWGRSGICCLLWGLMVVICPGFNLCLHPSPLPTSLGTYRQQKYVGFELGPLLWLWEEIERVCPASWLEMSALALLPRVEQPGLGGDLLPPGPKTPIWGPAQLGPLAVPPPGTTTTIPRQRYLSPASYIWGPDTFPHPRKLIPVSSLLSELSPVACHQLSSCFEHLRPWLCSHWGPSLALWDRAYLGELVLLVWWPVARLGVGLHWACPVVYFPAVGSDRGESIWNPRGVGAPDAHHGTSSGFSQNSGQCQWWWLRGRMAASLVLEYPSSVLGFWGIPSL